MPTEEENSVDWLVSAPEEEAACLSSAECSSENGRTQTEEVLSGDAGSNAPIRTPLVIEIPDDDNDGIVRVRVKRDGHRTSVSLDVMFYEAGSLLLGSNKAFEGWLQDQVTALDISWCNRAVNAKVGERVRPNAGLSRLIQRRVLQMVIEKASIR